MRIKLLILTFLFLFFGINSAFAGEPPIQLSPSNNSTVTSSKLEWQIPSYSLYSGGSYYMVQVDNQQDFTNPEKNNIYLTNNYYTPTLNPGTWYWRVKAKDSAGIWSNWSEGWSFNLNAATSTPSPTPSPTSSPTPAPSPTNLPISSFLISNIPSQINSDQSFKVTVNLSLPDKSNTKLYLKGAFRHPNKPSNYFGMTKVSGNWVKNGSSYSNQFPITTDSSGNWSDNLEVKPDIDDSGFTGSGNYIFKVGRYKDSDNSSVTWSNESYIEVAQVTGNNDANSSESTLQPTSLNPTNNPSAQTKSVFSKATSAPKFNYRIASVAATTTSATPTAQFEVKSQKETNYFVWAGIILIFAGAFSIGYIYVRKNANTHIKLRRKD